MRLNRGEALGITADEQVQISQQDIFAARKEVLNIHMAEEVEQYIIRLIMATRHPYKYSEQLASWLQMGVSPRATLALDRCARAHAWLNGRDFVTPEDVQLMAYPVLRHRLLLSYEAQAEAVAPDTIIEQLVSQVACA